MTDLKAAGLDPLTWLQGQAVADPVQRRVLHGLACRAAAQAPGPLRDALVARLVARWGARWGENPEARTPTPAGLPVTPRPQARTAHSDGGHPARLLAALCARLPGGPGGELRSLQLHGRTWGQLRLARRLAEVNRPTSGQLGPLNSQVLVTRALQALQTWSPAYLQRLLTQLDMLAALAPLAALESPAAAVKPGVAERLQPAKPAKAAKPAKPAKPAKKSPVRKRRDGGLTCP